MGCCVTTSGKCGRTFSALTGTALSRPHKRGKWLDQAQALQHRQTLREVTRNLNIHLSTAHRWRDRFLSAPHNIPPQALTGIAEADETFFLLSYKGKRSGLVRTTRKRGGLAGARVLSHEQVPALVARDRSGAMMYSVLKSANKTTLSGALKTFVARDAAFCTDASKAFAAGARERHHAVNLSASIRVDGAWHIQNVNGNHSRLKPGFMGFLA